MTFPVPIAVYVPSLPREEHKGMYSRSFVSQKHVGVELLKKVLVDAGYGVGYCSAATVNRFRVILVSITGAMEWYRFLAEREKWATGNYKVFVGGAGLTNIEPFLWAADCFVWGRAEGFIGDLIESALSGKRYRSESVCWSDEYDRAGPYRFAQATVPYSGELYCEDDKTRWREADVGCRRKCLFCLYSWTHYPLLHNAASDGQYDLNRHTESTFLTIDFARPPRITAIDGLSERLRMAVRKPITNAALVNGLVRLAESPMPRKRIKVFNIVGYPTESEVDYEELASCIKEADARCSPSTARRGIELACMPFVPEPSTPLACCQATYSDLRGKTALRLKRYTGSGHGRWDWFSGQAWWGLEMHGTLGLASQACRLLTTRGETGDADLLRSIARSEAFWKASTAVRMATLESACNIKRYFQRYRWEDLPTRGIFGLANQRQLELLESGFYRRLGDMPHAPFRKFKPEEPEPCHG